EFSYGAVKNGDRTNVSDLRAAAETLACDRETAPLNSPSLGVLRSLTFWACLLLAASGYGIATLAPSYVRNQQLKAEYVAADAELQRLVAQVDRYEQYCGRLTKAKGGGTVAGDGSVLAAPSPRPFPPQGVGLSRG